MSIIDNGKINFKALLAKYSAMQKSVMSALNSLTLSSGVSPVQFLMLQFTVTQLSQVGDSVSNIISSINSMINNSIRNQKGT